MIPKEAGGGRIGLATFLDVLVATFGGFLLARGTQDGSVDLGEHVLTVAGYVVAVGFVNQVFGMWVLRGSLGKLVTGLLVVRAKDGGRVGLFRAVGRWLVGYVLLVLMVAFGEGDTVGQAAGVRTVRRADLRAPAPAPTPYGDPARHGGPATAPHGNQPPRPGAR
ncbi:RDD family protein [Streptomyces zhaozhouensis]|uniref:RDD family protein n=1 Tax=Streptomyces zhaozhouensis TaxID=1300267 RepID=A0A286DKC0_9ACTN|nr:RDD family protein [Streptomyces zhaozhouensis]SOD59197.1 RDD family protein [Streptomyces zhaozhouensis]